MNAIIISLMGNLVRHLAIEQIFSLHLVGLKNNSICKVIHQLEVFANDMTWTVTPWSDMCKQSCPMQKENECNTCVKCRCLSMPWRVTKATSKSGLYRSKNGKNFCQWSGRIYLMAFIFLSFQKDCKIFKWIINVCIPWTRRAFSSIPNPLSKAVQKRMNCVNFTSRMIQKFGQ